MNVIGKPDVWGMPLQDWFNNNLVPLVGTPELGELRVKWYTIQAHAEQDGELVTVERWNGIEWEQHGLDAHMTVEDLDNLNQELGGEL